MYVEVKESVTVKTNETDGKIHYHDICASGKSKTG